MRILQINKYFYDRGGAEKVLFETIRGLRARGEKVSEFSMQHADNIASDFSPYFISTLPELSASYGIGQSIKLFRHLFRSKEVEQKLNALIDAERPEVAHIHNAYHQLSGSTFTTLKKRGIPMVMTVHDMFPLCPNHTLLHGETLGEQYFKNKPYNCVRYKCVQNSYTKSIAGTLEAYYYRYRGIWDMIDTFICPSQFMADKMIEYGFPEKKMQVIPNPFTLSPTYPPLGDAIVYLGRIHAEKGIKIFCRALLGANSEELLQSFPVIIAGRGPEDVWVDSFFSEHPMKNVERYGWVTGDAWQEIVRRARVIVVPSIFLENCSITILEALNAGRIVVATDRGGNPELIRDGVTGFLARPEDPADLARVLKIAMSVTPSDAARITEAGRTLVREKHNPDDYFAELMGVYRQVIQ